MTWIFPPPTTRMMMWPPVSFKTRPQWGRGCFADTLLPTLLENAARDRHQLAGLHIDQ